MTRRTTVIQPSTKVDALYTLPQQPFARRVLSACLFNAFTNGVPQLKIADVGGNVLVQISPTFFATSGDDLQPFTFLFASGLNEYGFKLTAWISPVFIPASIPDNLFVPIANILTVKLLGSTALETLPNLVLVTEDDDEDFLDA